MSPLTTDDVQTLAPWKNRLPQPLSTRPTNGQGRSCKTFEELSDDEKAKLTFPPATGNTQTGIHGDPCFVTTKDSAKGFHPYCPEKATIGQEIFTHFDNIKCTVPANFDQVANLLAEIPGGDIQQFAGKHASGPVEVISYPEDTDKKAFRFEVGAKTVLLIQFNDLDMIKERIVLSSRARKVNDTWIFAETLHVEKAEYPQAKKTTETPSTTNDRVNRFYERSIEHFYEKYDTAELRMAFEQSVDNGLIKANIPTTAYQKAMELWTRHKDILSKPDYMALYLETKHATADSTIVEPIEDDVCVVVDKQGKVLAANIENLVQSLLGSTFMPSLDVFHHYWRYFDYMPGPVPGDRRRLVNNYLQKQQPEKNPENVSFLEGSMFGTAEGHFGSRSGQGQSIYCPVRTFPGLKAAGKVANEGAEQQAELFFAKILKPVQDVFRFMTSRLDPLFYDDAKTAMARLPNPNKFTLNDGGEGDFLSFWAWLQNCYTAPHTDSSDWKDGFAHLMPYGDYEDGHLLLKELGIMFKYRPGAATICRGSMITYCITDYTGTRNVFVGTNKDEARNLLAFSKAHDGKLPPTIKEKNAERKRKAAAAGAPAQPTQADSPDMMEVDSPVAVLAGMKEEIDETDGPSQKRAKFE